MRRALASSTTRRIRASGSREIDEEFFTQLTQRDELVVTRAKGFTEWDKPKDQAREAGVCSRLRLLRHGLWPSERSPDAFVAMGKVKDEAGAGSATVASVSERKPRPGGRQPAPEPPARRRP